jgi:hypothetical protein
MHVPFLTKWKGQGSKWLMQILGSKLCKVFTPSLFSSTYIATFMSKSIHFTFMVLALASFFNVKSFITKMATCGVI